MTGSELVVYTICWTMSVDNWSADGTLWNRDAGVIIYHQDAAQYFQQVFLHDWENLAAAKALPD